MWYAIQTNSDDSWDYGSHDFSEAIEMLLADDIYQLIACIDEVTNYCVVELTRCEALALSETDFFGDLEE